MSIESGFCFLGLGLQAPNSSLGILLRENSAFLDVAPWMGLAPGAMRTPVILCVNDIGDAARNIIEPSSPLPAGKTHEINRNKLQKFSAEN